MQSPENFVVSAMDVLPVEVAILDDEGVILYTNEEWQKFGDDEGLRTESDNIGENYIEISEGGDEYAQMAVDNIRALIGGDAGTFSFEYPCHTPDEKHWFMMRGRRFVYDGDVYVLLAHLDITKRKLAEIDAENKAEKLEILNRIIRHDIRNEMNVLIGLAESLDQDGESEEVDKILRISEDIVNLTQTVRDLMEVKIDGIETKSVDLVYVLENEVEKARSSYPEAEFEASLPDEAHVSANEMLSSVFKNLLNNAVVHNDSEVPEVEIGVEVTDDSVVTSVSDNGPGVDDDRKEDVFGKDEKGLESPGTGIGLYLVNSLTQGYGGEVWIEDNQPRGSVFKVRIPRA